MYQVLARKYRPRNFAELVGQTHVSRALGSALERGRLHHAYLFTGTRGVGKTTIARILSKCLNCETGITATPCGVCGTCRAIDEGRFIDLIEIDAASRTKVEDTRELLDNVPYAPTQGRYKVYLIDEVHMLSTHSFNALLKTLEEPPEHVKFLLATTDPQKLPVTVLSRCLQFTLRPLPRQEIHDHLAQVLGKEQIAFDDAALWLLAESAQGSLRDAMSLTDQAIAYGQGSVQGADVQAMLGLLDRSQVAHLLQALHQGQGDRVAKILFDLTQQAVDVSAVLDQLITLLHQVALAQLLPKQADIGTPLEAEILHQLALSFDRQDVQLYYQIALQGRADLKLAVTAQQGFEMCVLRLLAFRPLAVTEAVILKQNHESALESDHIHAHQTSQPERLELNDDVELKKNSEVISPSVVPHPIAESSPDIVYPAEDTSLQVHEQPALVTSTDIDQVEQVELSDEKIDANDAELADQSFLASDMVGDGKILDFDQKESQAAAALVVDQLESVESPKKSIAVDEPLHASVEEITASVQTTTTVYQSGDLNPFEILAHPVAELSGEWTAEKWEYWLRERALVGKLFGGVLSLGQHGLMRGAIGGAIEFVIAAEHRVLTAEMRHGLLEALKEDWPQTQLEIINVTPDEITPVQRKELRIKQAQIKARELLVIDPVVAPLLTEFEGEIIELVMKEGLAG
ncbi:DNA polymerase III subunit gamma/tau [Aquirhabdus sp.]|uniref:DNA polymerase III subunit gamma/tau n=1 Tax=Aquirhabdus sp. TaxID=2824160 RepID=UPI00396C432C